jgi:hypothetical protein
MVRLCSVCFDAPEMVGRRCADCALIAKARDGRLVGQCASLTRELQAEEPQP